jgi:two-component system, NarL family, response regulator LiaR
MAPQDHDLPVRVALSNDFEIALLGLASMLARHPDKVQIVDITTEAKLPHEADVILYDTFGRLPVADPKLRAIIASNAGKVVVYSWDDYPEEAARRLGAVAYLHKGLNAEQLVEAVLAIHRGDVPPAVAVEKVVVPSEEDAEPEDVTGTADATWPGKTFGLSPRESEMLTFIVRGLTNQQIADRSYLTMNTVKTYIRNTYRKIGVKTRAQAVAWGYRHGFQSTDDTGV